ncbi:unnamed protein product, partial [Mesorhabditis belari]|uniref:Uncharacterized protein n=1 Tax=Mesorhabditis belari TaxID=2138241 RepID=A0AAF3F094_9BILA
MSAFGFAGFGGPNTQREMPIHAIVVREIDDGPWRQHGRCMAYVPSSFPPRPGVKLPMIFLHHEGFTFKLRSAGELDPAELKRLRRKAEESLSFGDEAI